MRRGSSHEMKTVQDGQGLACITGQPCCWRWVLHACAARRLDRLFSPTPQLAAHLQVVINYAASAAAAEEVAQAVVTLGGQAMTIKANVGSRAEIDDMFKQVAEKWGKVDVLVNNAGEQA
jgi:hypothetical protein